MTRVTIPAKLIDYSIDLNGYITYVFWNMEYNHWTNKYIMCVRFPNWENESFKLNDTGYLTYAEIIAGVDTWFDGAAQIPYRYTNIQFIKFILNKPDKTKDIIL